MRLVTALAIASITAAPAFAQQGPCVFCEPSFSASDIANGVACRVKRVTVLARNAGDCGRIGGKALKPAR
ncbi:MAG: hypothetical protein P4M07_12580 [Xanthobacteraceae bacterium]|nr:hypothetical protein [Xanthobacteraceae bacterium]